MTVSSARNGCLRVFKLGLIVNKKMAQDYPRTRDKGTKGQEDGT